MKNIITYLLTGVLLITSYSCDKQLSALPENARVDGTAIIDQQTAQTALNGVYSRLANISSDNITQWTNHAVYPAFFSGHLGYGFGSFPEEENMYQQGLEQMFWPEFYSVINSANGVINTVESLADNKFSDNRKKEIIGESKFLRAYNHFRLLCFFGEWYKADSKFGALIRDELSSLGNIPKKRSTVEESYEFILDDLDYAIENAPAVNPSHYVTKWAAMVLKMKVLLTRGTQADLTAAITIANNIIQSSPYVLENNAKDIFYVKGLSSQEVILGVMPQADQETYHYILSRQFYPGASSMYCAKKALKDLFPVGDPRGSWVIGPLTPYQAYSPNTSWFTKFIAVGGSPTQVSETRYILRLTEVYLMKAEAIIRSGGSLSDARTIIKNIMSKAGVTDFSAVDNATTANALLVENYYETVRSMVGEDGIEWMALLRLPFDTVKLIRPTITSQVQYILPIPSTELKNNPLFGDQNPGYQQF